jgi:hypothetical protein
MASASNPTLVFLITTVVALLVVSYFLVQDVRQEGFQNPTYTTRNLEINTCPLDTTEIQTSKGSTDCCRGDMVDGKCNGTTFCTKSPAYPGVPLCVDAWRQYFEKKGIDMCPPTMKNYYEEILKPNGRKGCSAGPITPNGEMPKDSTQKQCKIYPTEDENRNKRDSCHIEKLRSKIQCPVVNRNSPPAEAVFGAGNKFDFFLCRYPFELGMPDFCVDRATGSQYMSRMIPNWRTSKQNVERFEEVMCERYIRRRQQVRAEAARLQEEQRRREAAEAARKKAEEDARKRAQQASRLQQQLDEANRKLLQCKK